MPEAWLTGDVPLTLTPLVAAVGEPRAAVLVSLTSAALSVVTGTGIKVAPPDPDTVIEE